MGIREREGRSRKNKDSRPPPISLLPTCYFATGRTATGCPSNILKIAPLPVCLHSSQQSPPARSRLALPWPLGYRPRQTPHPLSPELTQQQPSTETYLSLSNFNIL